MVTRSGDMDPSIVTYIMEKENLPAKEMESILNKKSGLAAISKMSPDFRYIEQMSYSNDEAKLAINIFCEKVAEYIARYATKMYGVDAIIFTGGIGENQINIREKICEHLIFMGLDFDEKANKVKGETVKISTDKSKIQVYVIPTDEEMMIAKDTVELI